MLTGFTVLRNAYRLGYPFVEACLSVIDHVDSYVFAICDDDDSTRYYCQRLQRQFPKIMTVSFPWPEGGQTGLSIGWAQTKAMRSCSGEYLWLIQADEVYWSESAAMVRATVTANPAANAFSLPFSHILENFQSINPSPHYREAIRVVRNLPTIQAENDGWTFCGSVHPVVPIVLPKPIFHPKPLGGLCDRRRRLSHAHLYPDLPEYQERSRRAQAEVEHAIVSAEWEITTPNVEVPPILRDMVGIPEYYVRTDLLTDQYRRLIE